MREPLAARFHFVPRALRRPHAALIRTLRGYFSKAPGWVLLTTRGRRTGLPREVLLPCARTDGEIIVISTYGTRSDWLRNIRKDPRVEVTVRGRSVPARAEIVDDVFHKRAIVSANPFFPAAPFGPGWERLSALNPRLVYCAISGYGQDGPYRDRVGHDVNYLAAAGVLNYVGAAGEPPVIPGVQIADLGAGSLMAAVGILTALIARERTGRGQLVDVAMLDGAVAWNVYHTLLYLLSGRPPERGKTQLTGYFPCYAVYEARDGRHVTVGAYEEHFWTTLCRHFGREDFIQQQWDEGAKRLEMFAFFRAAFRTKTLAEWVAELGDVDICFAPVATLEEAFADPQVRHRGMVGAHGGTLTLGP